jgi:pimeloyl-ACP methyl ester carboxylesterase
VTLARTSVGDGTPVLLVPGYTGSKEDFRLLLQPLADAGYRAVAYDQRGQYESDGPDDPAAYTVEALAADLLELATELGPVHLVGHSFGGLVSRAAVLRRPDAFLSLTLLDSGPAALTGPRVDALPLLRPLLEQGGILAVADALDAVAPADEPPELRAFLRTRFLRNSPTGLIAMAEALTTEPDRVDELRATGVRVQVVYGEADDAWSPAAQAEMAARLGCRTVVIAESVHSPAVENPTATLDALLSFF